MNARKFAAMQSVIWKWTLYNSKKVFLAFWYYLKNIFQSAFEVQHKARPRTLRWDPRVRPYGGTLGWDLSETVKPEGGKSVNINCLNISRQVFSYDYYKIFKSI